MKLIPQLSIDVIVSASVGALFYYKATLSTNHTSTPIFITTAVTILGHFSLVFMLSAGAEVLNSIGIILVAGMAMGTFFCLFLLIFAYFWLAESRRINNGMNLLLMPRVLSQ